MLYYNCPVTCVCAILRLSYVRTVPSILCRVYVSVCCTMSLDTSICTGSYVYTSVCPIEGNGMRVVLCGGPSTLLTPMVHLMTQDSQLRRD